VALRALFSSGLGLGLAMVIGKSLNRPRPFEAGGVQEILFHRPDYSFPSDHATLLFALAMSFYLSGYKKLAYLMLVLGITIGAARVMAGVHYPSDIIAGALVGIIAAYLLKLLDPIMDHVYRFIISLAKKIRLA
jgi:undecaprenyl-diphosphatase